MSDAAYAVLAVVAAPVVVLGVVGMVRGYHMTLWVHRKHKGDEDG